ncbi:MAG: hypothetical protein ACXWLH_02360 [Candidatus Saccharimonadales bacterium]
MPITKTTIESAAANVLDFDELYYEISNDWQHKAKDLQRRRWRKLRRQIVMASNANLHKV